MASSSSRTDIQDLHRGGGGHEHQAYLPRYPASKRPRSPGRRNNLVFCVMPVLLCEKASPASTSITSRPGRATRSCRRSANSRQISKAKPMCVGAPLTTNTRSMWSTRSASGTAGRPRRPPVPGFSRFRCKSGNFPRFRQRRIPGSPDYFPFWPGSGISGVTH
jgi:hypothetical protein